MTTIWILMLAAAVNLLPNGDFKQGKTAPEGWDRTDNLTSFWVDEPGRGRVLKIDSRLERKPVLEYWEALKKNPQTPPPKPVLAKAPFFSAIGGMEGVFIDSTLIDVKKGQDYKLTVDVKGDSTPFVWIKGFRKHPRRDMMIDSYQTRLSAPVKPEDGWKTFSIGFNPTARTPHTEKMKVRIFVYWPVGVCYFDRVRIEPITPAEMAELVKQRSVVEKD